MLAKRIASGLTMGAAYLLATFYAPPAGVVVAAGLLGAVGLLEFYSLLDAARLPNFKLLGTLIGVGWIVAAWMKITCWVGNPRCPDWDLLAINLGFFAVFVRQFRQARNPRPLETMAGTLMGLLYVAFPIGFLVRLVLGWGGVRGRWLLLFLIVVVKFTDIGAFFIGSWLGRHKLIPRVSPAKTWEGCIGGVLTAVAAGFLVRALLGGDLGAVRLSAMHTLLLSLLLSVAGILGDLAESLLKRAAGVKDSATYIAGMGGMLDVFDSILPALPLLYFYAKLFLPPLP